MLVGIDASRAARAIRTGTEGYSLHLIEALLRRPGDTDYRLYVDRVPGGDFPRSDRAECRVIRLPRLWTQVRLAADLVRQPPDLLFVPSHVIPVVCPVPSVATIHDVGYLWHRSAYTPFAWFLLHLGTLRNARAARLIVVDSQATARDLVDHFRVAPERIRVAYLGAPPVRDLTPDRSILARYSLPANYFLFVGTLQPRKNLGRLLQAFARVIKSTRTQIVLALAGAPGVGTPRLVQQAAELGIDNRIRWLSYVPSQDVPHLYAGAVGFVYPSLYEGFGLPALEAMALGTPVIASNGSSLPEVVGSAGLLVDPYDVDGLARTMIRLLDDNHLRNRLIVAGREQVRHFSWDRCAAVVESTLVEAVRGVEGSSGTNVADRAS